MSAPGELRHDDRRRTGETTLIIGGAGFVGANLADRIASDGGQVLIFDNLSRPGVERNAAWLQMRHPERVTLRIGDVRDPLAVADAVGRAHRVFHLAAQVAVTTSLLSPLEDFAINAAGTLNVLEAARARRLPPPLVFTSTNKVYGHLDDLEVTAASTGYQPCDPDVRRYGLAEDRPLTFGSPYGCSKGAADQYVLDYARTFGLPATVLRMSCIYGPRQFGTEDQGWVAHFARRIMDDRPISIFGDGLQVRDILYVDDLVDALLLASRRVERTRGVAFNMGGGPSNAVSLLRVLELIGHRLEHTPRLTFGPWRPADQRFYVSDTRRFQEATGWQPTVPVEAGIGRLVDWLRSSLTIAET
ncbi:MAG: NAD-dependent epimerase/dehydratase family protein, partial [Geminicoccaceae bacterium]|nr:NAD-dependent epimerase/dehydratase family protein [Geminicoccaceae bacterium]